MGAIASQITSLTIVYSTVYSVVDQSKHQSSASLAFVWGIHRGPVNAPHKWPVMRKMFPFDDVIMVGVGSGVGVRGERWGWGCCGRRMVVGWWWGYDGFIVHCSSIPVMWIYIYMYIYIIYVFLSGGNMSASFHDKLRYSYDFTVTLNRI